MRGKTRSGRPFRQNRRPNRRGGSCTGAADIARHDRMVALVERMLELHKKLAATAIAADRTLYQRQIDATDRQIDALVYDLYGLTADEIAIVEESTGP